MSSNLEPYQGPRKLVLAFDVGTTYSSISYSILDPGEVPRVLGVSRYPAQHHIGGDNKIPSILYYDQRSCVRAVGSEALQNHILEQAEDEEWIKVEWWKLHLRPKTPTPLPTRAEDIPPLPQDRSAVQVLADFVRYLFACARNYIIESHAKGASLWTSLENSIEFILTHPNGWQQQQFRQAAEVAGLISSSDEHASRIHLLAEGEAMTRFCVDALVSIAFSDHIVADTEDRQEEADEWTEQQGVIVIDAGSGTVNLHAYSLRLSLSKEFKEVAPTECRPQGFAFVTRRAHAFLRAKLANSRYGSPDIIQQMTEAFDKSTKLRFHDANKVQYIKFGTLRDKDPQYDIRSGQLKLAGEDVARFFQPAVDAIVDAFEKQRQAAATSRIQIKVTLNSAFSASDFLYRSLRLHPTFSQVNLYRPPHQGLAVVNGGVLSYIDRATWRTPGSSRDPG